MDPRDHPALLELEEREERRVLLANREHLA